MSGSTARKRTTHQCGPSMRCTFCDAAYPWTDPECPMGSAERRERAVAAKRAEAEARAQRMAAHFGGRA